MPLSLKPTPAPEIPIEGAEMIVPLVCIGIFFLIVLGLLGITGIYAAQPVADVLTILVCILSIPAMKRIASKNMLPGSTPPAEHEAADE